jgi:hypothetical protein
VKRRKVSVAHPRWLSRGSKARALSPLQALAGYNISLITCGLLLPSGSKREAWRD